MTRPPNPGSDEAMALGCTCSPEFNDHGAGAVEGRLLFWYNPACPLHGIAAMFPGWDDDDNED